MDVADINNWASNEIKTIRITQDVADNYYDLQVRQFVPQRGDALERTWKTDGIEQSFECAPYGIANMKRAGKTLLEYADRTLESSIDFYIDKKEPLLFRTYCMVYRQSQSAEVSIIFICVAIIHLTLICSGRRKDCCFNPHLDCGVLLEWKVGQTAFVALKHWE